MVERNMSMGVNEHSRGPEVGLRIERQEMCSALQIAKSGKSGVVGEKLKR